MKRHRGRPRNPVHRGTKGLAVLYNLTKLEPDHWRQAGTATTYEEAKLLAKAIRHKRRCTTRIVPLFQVCDGLGFSGSPLYFSEGGRLVDLIRREYRKYRKAVAA